MCLIPLGHTSSKTDVFFEETSPEEVLDPQEEFHESDSFNSSLQGNVLAIPPPL